MSDDLTQTQQQGDEAYERAREWSRQQRRAPGQVPGYLMGECLGEGAYGEVWLATDQNNPGRRVAVKFYTRRGGDWSLLAREVEKLNFLATDRYIVQLLDVGWDADPPYYVMEYMENGSLAKRLESGPLPVAEAVALFREVTIGVVNAHNRGVLHCDLKPANVLLGPDKKPRLADFGQSRLTNEQTPSLGTLFYMAPEQADLKSVPDARWDVYALGALLYCLLTGESPYRDSPGATTLEEPRPLEERLACYRKLVEESPRPRKHRRVPGIDRALVEIVNRCLAVKPDKRYPNAQAVLDALNARALSRARRPLLVLGALGPILLLTLMAYVTRADLLAAVDQSSAALLEESRVSNQFAAQAVAAKVAGKIDRRWRTLEQEADDPTLLRLIRAARQKPFDAPEQRALQKWLVLAQSSHPDVPADSWSVFDESGTLMARSPRNAELERKFVGKNFAHRNFFNGLDHDLDENTPHPPPLTQVHRSNVFKSTLTGTLKVAFSVPIWRDEPGPNAPRVGVLMMTVEVGGFLELREGEGPSRDFVAVLIDREADTSGRRGAILDHPYLAQLRKEKVPEDRLQFFVDPQEFDHGSWDPDARDPIGAASPEYAGRWLAASHKVLLDERQQGSDIGWVVVVQERYDIAIGPVLRLKESMLARGWWTLGIAVAVVTGLWAFVIVVLNNNAGGSRLMAFLRRRTGRGGDRTAFPRVTSGPASPLPATAPWSGPAQKKPG